MTVALKSAVRKILHRLNLDVISHRNLITLQKSARAGADLALLAALSDGHLRPALDSLPFSQSQLRQDIFALSETGFKRNGFFVEFGATDGRTLSNSWLLEKKFGWSGILAEPGRGWRSRLVQERNAKLDFDCVWHCSGEVLEFIETPEAELSTVAALADGDRHARSRRTGHRYAVNTVSLNDLLTRHGAPAHMDFLSIDTEGSEFDILNALDFDRYSFAVICCEHNFTRNRELIYNLLSANGYSRKHPELSDFDDWYVLREPTGSQRS